MELNRFKGLYEPVVSGADQCLKCPDKPCLKVCPSYEEDFIELANWTEAAQEIGPYHSIYTSFSYDRANRLKSSSGGFIREILGKLIRMGVADSVITLKHSEGLEYEPSLYEKDDSFDAMPGSIYHNINFEKAIEILKTRSDRVILVATPCQLTSIKKWERLFSSEMKASIACTIGLICGWMFSRRSLEHFTKAEGIDFQSVSNVTYRGGDKIGNLVIGTPSGPRSFSRRPRLRDSHFSSFRIAFSRSYNSRRCLLCAEHLNYLADISVGDAWLSAFDKERDGISLVIVRNRSFDPAIQELKTEGRIQLSPATVADVIESQSRDIAKGIGARKLMAHLKTSGQFSPHIRLPLPDVTEPSLRLLFSKELFPSFVRRLNRGPFGYIFYRIRRPFFFAKEAVHFSFRRILRASSMGRTFHAYLKQRFYP
jgi:coenzyme F420 hydrogenase subunit beta